MVGAEGGATSPAALTVAIAAGGPEQPLLVTLASLARDPEAPCEILVIDDGLRESSRLAARAAEDSRIRIRRNGHSVGMVASLQQAASAAATPFIMLLRPGDVVLPGAVRALSEVLAESPAVGLAHAYWFPLAPLDRVSRSALLRYRRRLARRLPAAMDHRRALVVEGNIVQALPTFRRDVLAATGGLEGGSLDDAVYGAALRVLARAEARLVPRLLCGRPMRGSHAAQSQGLRRYLRQLQRCARVVHGGGAEYLRSPPWRLPWLASLGLLRQLAALLPRDWIDTGHARAQRLVHAARSISPFAGAVGPGPYDALVSLLGRWPFDSLRPRRGRPRPAGGERVAYVLWRYPVLTETFIRREVQALRSAGVCLDVVTLEAAAPALPADPESPAGAVIELGLPDTARGRAAARAYLRRKPWTVVRLWLFVVRHRYRAHKTWWQDRDILYLAAQLADLLAERGTTHVHSPWADHSALLTFLASRLLGVTYSVQARAADVHRSAQAPLVADRVGFAEFLVTNSQYNERYLRSMLVLDRDLPIHTIYNGIELPRFHPVPGRPGTVPLRLLSVGRLVESKGFRYLLDACRLLRDRGIAFTCEIVGGPQDPAESATWIDLRKRHSQLGLESTVTFRGALPLSSVLSAYRRADIVVLPSVRARDGSHDVTPNTLIEAMALGLPVVSTTTGAIPEIVDHEVDGLLVPPKDADALAAALERLLQDVGLRQRLGEAARRKVEGRFDIDRNVERRARLFWLPAAGAPE